MPNKIENTLSHDQLAAFLDELRGIAAKPTYAQIQATAERYGVSVSLMSARTFAKNTYKEHLERLANGREKTEAILKVIRGSESPLTAFEATASVDILDEYTSGGEVDRDKLIKAGATLRSAVSEREASARAEKELERKQSETRAKLALAVQQQAIAEERARKLERERKAWEVAQKKIAQANDQLRSAAPEDADAVRARVVDLLDDVLGIKPKK